MPPWCTPDARPTTPDGQTWPELARGVDPLPLTDEDRAVEPADEVRDREPSVRNGHVVHNDAVTEEDRVRGAGTGRSAERGQVVERAAAAPILCHDHAGIRGARTGQLAVGASRAEDRHRLRRGPRRDGHFQPAVDERHVVSLDSVGGVRGIEGGRRRVAATHEERRPGGYAPCTRRRSSASAASAHPPCGRTRSRKPRRGRGARHADARSSRRQARACHASAASPAPSAPPAARAVPLACGSPATPPA